MALYRRPTGVFYYDFVIEGARYNASTGQRDRARARAIEAAKRRDAEQGLLKPVNPREHAVSEAVRAAVDAAIEVTAAAYGVAADHLRLESRGRGPRPPPGAWEARKMALHLAVIVAGCTYAEAARALGLHKDTASSHCASAREACAESDELEQFSLALETCIRVRLSLAGHGATQLRSAA